MRCDRTRRLSPFANRRDCAPPLAASTRPTIARWLTSFSAVVLFGLFGAATPAVAQSRPFPSTPPAFENPPLRYSGESLGDGYFPRVAALPAASHPAGPMAGAAIGPDSRLAQRPTETPVRLPQDDMFHGDEFFPPPSDDDEGVFAGPKLSAFKSGFFQKLSFTETWLDRGKASDYGVHEMELFLTCALPAPTVEWPLLITPYFNMRLLDGPLSAGPNTPELPSRLYETYVDFMWVPRLSERLIAIIAAAPSVYGDFDADGFRMTGKGLVRYDIVPEKLQLLAGVLYLNRDDIRLLPAGGLIWAPNPDMRYELVFPKPKLAHRIAFGQEWEDWLYLSGEFGGNTFAFRRSDGVDDKVTLRDWRVMIGLERKLNGGAGFRLEIGYVFSRTLEYASTIPDASQSPTAMIRAGFVF